MRGKEDFEEREKRKRDEGERERGKRKRFSFRVFGFSKPEYILFVIFRNEVSFLHILSRIFDILTITTKT